MKSVSEILRQEECDELIDYLQKHNTSTQGF